MVVIIYGSWIYNCLCNQYLSPLSLLVWITFRWGVLDSTLCDKDCQWLAPGQWFSPGTLVSSTNKTDCHDITEILLKVVFNTITHPPYFLSSNLKWGNIYYFIFLSQAITNGKITIFTEKYIIHILWHRYIYRAAQTENAKSMSFQGLSQRGINE